MADLELIYVTEARCDACEEIRVCNIYRTPLTCQCAACKAKGMVKYRYRNICGSCLGHFLKSRDIDDAE